MRSPMPRLCALAACLLLCSSCASNRSHDLPKSPPIPQGPSGKCLERCAALQNDGGNAASEALTADTANREQYITCQIRQACLVDYVRKLIDRHIVAKPGHD